MKYASDTIILKTRSEVKVTVTQNWYKTYHHPKLHPYTRFGIPTSNNTEICIRLGVYSRNEIKGQGHSDPKMKQGHSCIPRCTHTRCLGFLPQKKRYDPGMIILKTRSEVKFKVTVTCK